MDAATAIGVVTSIIRIIEKVRPYLDGVANARSQVETFQNQYRSVVELSNSVTEILLSQPDLKRIPV